MTTDDRSNEPTPSCCPSGNCGGIARRDFIKTLTLGAAAAASAIPGMPVMAGPFEASEQGKLVPADKKLDPAVGQVALRPGCPRGLSRQGPGKDRHAHRRTLRGPTLPGRRRQALALGHLQQGRWAPATATTPIRRSPRRRWNRASPSRSRPAERSKCGPWTSTGFSDITFCGEYPIAYVEYRDPQSPVTVSLEAFSPHVPLDTQAFEPAGDGDALHGQEHRATPRSKCELAGWLENAVGLYTAPGDAAERQQPASLRKPELAGSLQATSLPTATEKSARPDIVFEDFQKETYEGWTVTGDAFGKGPILKSEIPAYQGDVGSPGPAGGQFARLGPRRQRRGRTAAPARSPASRSRSSATSSASGSAAAIIRAKRASTCSSTARSCARPPATTAIACGRTASTCASSRARRPGWRSSTRQPGRGAISASGPIVFTDRQPAKRRRASRLGHAGLGLLEPREGGPALRQPSGPANRPRRRSLPQRPITAEQASRSQARSGRSSAR